MSAAFGYRKAQDLPPVIAIFPLEAVLLLPGAPLPLNVFEPRYLNMVDDAFAGDRLIGMTQTRPDGDGDIPALETVGCVGRITSYAETRDGRYVITLTGVCRFAIERELEVASPYRQARVDFTRFADDLAEIDAEIALDREAFMAALSSYLEANGMNAEWSSINAAPPQTLVNSLAMICPFTPAEKQALLLAPTLQERADTLFALLRMGAAPDADGGVQ